MKYIDEIDAKILFDLLQDGRKSYMTIAEECQVSKDIIWNHYTDMKKAGFIVGSTVQYNYQAFGYEGVATLMINVESQYLKSTIEKLRNMSNMFPLRQYNSQFNICVISTIKDLKSLDKTKEEIKRNCPVNAISTNVWIDCRNIPENLVSDMIKNDKFLEAPKQTKEIRQNQEIKLDSVDHKIVEELVKDGRKPFKKIGEFTGCSTDTVMRRYEKLVKNGYIKVSTQINPQLLGFNGIATFQIFSSSQKESRQHIESLGKIPHLAIMVKVSGDFELQLTFFVKDFQEVFDINNRLMDLHDIAKIWTDIKPVPNFWPGPQQQISTF